MEDKNNLGLYLNLKTYQTKYKGIFHYNDKNHPEKVNTTPLFIKKDCFLFRTKNNEIISYDQQALCKYGEENIFQVKVRENEFIIKSPISKSLYEPTTDSINIIKNKLWYIINSKNDKKEIENNKENEDYYLKKGDFIKLGTELYILSEIAFKEEKEKNNEKDKEKVKEIIKEKEKEKKVKEEVK